MYISIEVTGYTFYHWTLLKKKDKWMGPRNSFEIDTIRDTPGIPTKIVRPVHCSYSMSLDRISHTYIFLLIIFWGNIKK